MHEDEQIRERAYHLWQKEGSPDGREHEFWERARLMHHAAAVPPISTPLQERTPEEKRIDQGLAETFPASDPVAASAPTKATKAKVARKPKG